MNQKKIPPCQQTTIPADAHPAESGPTRLPSSLRPGQDFGPYRITRLLGRGGMGEVYEAGHRESGRRVALKVLADLTGSPSERARFLREGRLAAQISHPHAVYVFGTEEIEGRPAISMELTEGGTLKDRVDREGPLPIGEAVDAILQAIEGLAAASGLGVLHRDVKPSNCFVEEDGTVKIGDFGLSISTLARVETQLTAAGSILGTPAYASPEQLQGKELDVRSDIYSVGATLFDLLTGRPPFETENVVNLIARIVQEKAPSPRSLRPEIPRGLAAVILRCLEKNPSARFATYADLARSLFPFGTASGVPARLRRRFTAGVIDTLLLSLPGGAYGAYMASQGIRSVGISSGSAFSLESMSILCFMLYYALLEGAWGASLGKMATGLRVVGPMGRDPGFLRALARASIFLILPGLPVLIWHALPLLRGTASVEPSTAISLTGFAILALMFTTARRTNGFAAVHDLATSTRVIRKAAFRIRRNAPGAAPAPATLEGQLPLGPFMIPGDLSARGPSEVVSGVDPVLRRNVWIHVLPIGTPSVTGRRRDLSRPGRIRWLSGHRSPETCWDAYEAPEGRSLTATLSQKNPWRRVRYWLLDLAEEIEAGARDGSNPAEVGLGSVWISSSGRAKLLDFPAPGATVPTGDDGKSRFPTKDVASVQAFLLSVALSAVEGAAVSLPAGEGRPPSIPLPLHARDLLVKLKQGEFRTLPDLISALKALLSERTDFSRSDRLRYVAGFAILPAVPVVAWIARSFISTEPFQLGEFLLAGAGFCIVAVALLALLAVPGLLFAFAVKGGAILQHEGIAVVLADGSRASRSRTLWRALVAWSPALLPVVLAVAAVLLAGPLDPLPDQPVPEEGGVDPEGGILARLLGRPARPLELLFPLLFLLHIAGAFWFVLAPDRGPQDRAAGTYLIPR